MRWHWRRAQQGTPLMIAAHFILSPCTPLSHAHPCIHISLPSSQETWQNTKTIALCIVCHVANDGLPDWLPSSSMSWWGAHSCLSFLWTHCFKNTTFSKSIFILGERRREARWTLTTILWMSLALASVAPVFLWLVSVMTHLPHCLLKPFKQIPCVSDVYAALATHSVGSCAGAEVVSAAWKVGGCMNYFQQ